VTDPRRLDQRVCAEHRDILDVYVELELAGGDTTRAYPATAIHLLRCPGCRARHDGLLEAVRRYGDAQSD
jgi:hypothetical protein